MSDVRVRKFLQKWHKELFELANEVDFNSFLFLVKQTRIIIENIEKDLTTDE